jgi:DNA-binding FadR family transcriptional regulator
VALASPFEKQSVSDAVFQQILGRIIWGELEPGSQLPGERLLGETLGVNRGAIREATKRLEQAGLLSIQHGGGTRVLDFRASGALSLLADLCVGRSGKLDLEIMRSIVELRNSVFPDVARLAAERATAGTVRELRDLLDAHEEAGRNDEPQRIADLQLDFWLLLARGGQNLAYALMLNTLGKAYSRIAPRSQMSEMDDLRARDLGVLKRIAAAVESHDGSAAESAARSYIVTRNQGLLEGLERALQRRGDRVSTPVLRDPRGSEGASPRRRSPRRQLASDTVFDALLEQLVSGELRSGDQLPG